MKKIAFVVQVLTMIIALPLLTVLEINHGGEKAAVKKTTSYVNASAKNSTFNATASVKIPS